jgi:hypothetical protein
MKMPRNEIGPGRRLCLPIEQWPEADRAAWQWAIQDAGPFGRNSTASAWAEATRAGTVAGYGRWLSWISEKGLKMNEPPADRVTPPRVKAYILDLRGINGGSTIVTRVEQLYNAIRVIAPDRDWGWLLRVQSALQSRSVPVRDKRTHIRPTAELVKLGKTLMHAAESAVTKPPLKQAILFRDGLMIAFLACRPLRLSNLAMMTLERHLVRQASGYGLHFDGREVKGGKPIEAGVPASLVGDFDRYLDHYRPILLTRGGAPKASGMRCPLDFSDRCSTELESDPRSRHEAHRRSLWKASLGASLPPLRRIERASCNCSLDSQSA